MTIKITSVDDPSGQIGEFLDQLSNLYSEYDKELTDSYTEITAKYQPKIDELNDLIANLRSLLS